MCKCNNGVFAALIQYQREHCCYCFCYLMFGKQGCFIYLFLLSFFFFSWTCCRLYSTLNFFLIVCGELLSICFVVFVLLMFCYCCLLSLPICVFFFFVCFLLFLLLYWMKTSKFVCDAQQHFHVDQSVTVRISTIELKLSLLCSVSVLTCFLVLQ